MSACHWLVLLLLFLVAAADGARRAKHVTLDKEDDDFAEFDFDAEEEWEEEGEVTLISAPLGSARAHRRRCCSGGGGGRGGTGGGR